MRLLDRGALIPVLLLLGSSSPIDGFNVWSPVPKAVAVRRRSTIILSDPEANPFAPRTASALASSLFGNNNAGGTPPFPGAGPPGGGAGAGGTPAFPGANGANQPNNPQNTGGVRNSISGPGSPGGAGGGFPGAAGGLPGGMNKPGGASPFGGAAGSSQVVLEGLGPGNE
ncbi:expressed unknown protein [Seminavis robusta]|uniref:Uncharacterized protein n=1 Tax=Seminavis robusta TaxID=568900 RepID=A0A9N8H6C3_9STRA|nr:expressed unknown protein [Seminavis robusta]|eukprot:Sro96_g049580.1 n/a (170) ;mRNA; r:57737-58246